jgi:peptidoglycan/LPS O-acetylase OafA/YrhL
MEDKTFLNYRADIDGLRAVAVLFVIIFHAFPKLLAGGFIGVDIFFVISGYLISGIILKSLKDNKFSYVDFYRRRIKRIFPALIAVLIACLVAGWIFLFSGEYSSLGKHVAAGAGFIANITYWLESGYFDVSSTLKPLVHLWSLGVEEQFYIFWPILLVFIYRKIKKVPQIISILLFLSFLLSIYVGFRSPEAAFYLPFTRFWELMSGAILAYFSLSNGGIVKSLVHKFNIDISDIRLALISNTLSWFGFIFMILSVIVINNANFYSGIVLLSIVGIFLIIESGPQAWVNRKILSNKILVYIGLISYPLYLWHWPLLSFANIIKNGSVSTVFKIVLLLISFLLAWMTYIFIEKPIRHSKAKWVSLLLFVILLSVGVDGLIIYFNNGFNFRLPKQELLLKEVRLNAGSLLTKTALKDETKICLKLFPQKFNNSLHCYATGSGQNRVFVIGDSHAIGIYAAYRKSLVEMGYTVINLGISSCSVISDDTKELSLKLKNCNEDLKKVISIVISENPKAVIMSNDAGAWNKNNFEFSMNKILSFFPSNTKILWFLQTPRADFNLMKCVSRSIFYDDTQSYCAFPIKLFNQKIRGMKEIVNKLIKKYPQVITVNPGSVLCSSKECPIILGNHFMYEDQNMHLSIFGGHYLADRLPIKQYFTNLKQVKFGPGSSN